MRKSLIALSALCGAAVTIGGCISRSAQEEQQADPKAASGSTVAAVKPLAGSTSCAGRACHGRLERSTENKDYTLDEFTTWVMTDPHVNAYHVLEQTKSIQIATALGLVDAEGKSIAHQSERCLVCHTTSEAAKTPKDPDLAAHVIQERSMGVGCEACHGNANGWVNEHITKSWKDLKDKPEKKEKYGWVNVGDGVKLAERCVRCHVGYAPEKGDVADVNHDLIAAGHPRLNFEFSAFFNNLPVHWTRKIPDQVQRWGYGQIITAKAALDLLEYRAGVTDDKDETRVWPEFAEYDCYACHHNLTHDPKAPAWRQDPDRSRKNARRDALPWGSWYFAIPRSLDAMPKLAELTKLMEARRPKASDVKAAVKSVREELDTLHKQAAGWNDAHGRRKALLGIPLKQRDWSWDAAEQTFLSLYALNQVDTDQALQSLLDGDLMKMRAFPSIERPPPLDPEQLKSPRSHPDRQKGFFPEDFFKALPGAK